jgi:3-oxoacyl-[acyl-carrier protein] reductase
MKKSILVTGSSRGIGKAIALYLAKQGYDLVLHCRSQKTLADEVITEIEHLGQSARLLQFDISDRAQCAEQLNQDIESYGAYYGVVCNAGITADNAFPALTGEDWDNVIHTNLDSFYNVLQPVIMPMIRRRKPGRIVTLSSVSGIMGNRGQVNYSAAKAGIIGATKALALELAKRHITVNCVAPGLIATDMLDELPLGEINLAEITKMIPARRVGDPKEVAAAVAFLMSEDASYITRQVLSVNGGLC